MKIDLSKVMRAKGVAETPNKYVIIGDPGAGKTTLAAHFPNPFIIPAAGEGSGIRKLAEAGKVPEDAAWYREIGPKTEGNGWVHLLHTLKTLHDEEHDFKTVVLDCFDEGGFVDLAYRHHCDESYGGDMGHGGFMNFQQGYKTAVPEIQRATHGALEALIRKGMDVVLLMHSTIGEYKNPEGRDFHQFGPKLHKPVWDLIRDWSDLILYVGFQTVVTEENGRGKAMGGQNRVIHCSWTPFRYAKHRHGLPDTINLPNDPTKSYETLHAAMKNAKEKANA